MDWLFASIDPSRAHEVGFAVSWHGRAMVLAWGVLAPLAVLVARFFKILPGQNWPTVLDSQFWWRSHWIGQSLVAVLSVLGLVLVLPSDFSEMTIHGWLGYTLLGLMVVQIVLGVFRGSKGGPTALAPDGTPRGDHYDMTRWRCMFEWVHKVLGYTALALALAVVALGLWTANAPVWMCLTIGIWWIMLATVFVILQRRGHAIDTYQAIWGPDLEHPGNRQPPIGWGIRRPVEHQPGE